MPKRKPSQAVSRGSRRVAVLAVLSDLDSSYSVSGVVLSQLRLLTRHLGEVVFITTNDFKDSHLLPPGVEVRLYPRFPGAVNATQTDSNFETYVALTSKVLSQLLADCTTCITHDTIFLHDFLAVNWAIRRAAERLPNLHWLHWIHSAPSTPQRQSPYPLIGCFCGMPRSEIVYVNRSDVPAVAEMFNIPETHVRVVHNFVDPLDFLDCHPLVREIASQMEFWSADTIAVYPTRTTIAKQPDKILKLCAALKERGESVRVVFCNSYSNADAEKELVAQLLEMSQALQFAPHEVLFTSTFQSEWAQAAGHNLEMGVPHEVVRNLMHLSDLFVLPSVSEACSIIMLEAALCKNLLLLNEDLASLHEFGGQVKNNHASDRAVYYSFGSLSRPVIQYNPSEEEWYRDHARALINYQSGNQAIQFFKYTRKKHSPDWIFRHQLEPLLR